MRASFYLFLKISHPLTYDHFPNILHFKDSNSIAQWICEVRTSNPFLRIVFHDELHANCRLTTALDIAILGVQVLQWALVVQNLEHEILLFSKVNSLRELHSLLAHKRFNDGK